MSSITPNLLNRQIEEKRLEMILTGLSNGLTDVKTLLLSQQLDELMNLNQMKKENEECMGICDCTLRLG
jgi:hypothetical protein